MYVNNKDVIPAQGLGFDIVCTFADLGVPWASTSFVTLIMRANMHSCSLGFKYHNRVLVHLGIYL